MSRFRTLLGLMTWLALVTVLFDAGCSRPTLSDTEGNPAADSHPLPFDAGGEKGAEGSNATSVSAVSNGPAKTETRPPFRDPDSLPAGTLLIVRLNNSVSAHNRQ